MIAAPGAVDLEEPFPKNIYASKIPSPYRGSLPLRTEWIYPLWLLDSDRT